MTESNQSAVRLAGLPEQGQLVEVRQRRYVVNEISASTLQPSPLVLDRSAQQHLLTLTSVDDEGLGEELQVIWELEPGAQIYDQSGLPRPDAFDPPHRLDAFLNAVRWGAIATTNDRTLQAPFRSGIEIEAYQLDPLVRALQMPRVNLLVADDVGLGKTIEAGLVVQEMILRYRVQRVLIVCPAGLQIQWRDQMLEKFGLDFRIVDSTLMKSLRRRRGLHVNPWTHFPRLITSMDYLKRDRPMRLFKEVLPKEGMTYPRKFDMLIVDEAHNVAPSGNGRYAVDSQRTKAIRTLAPHFEHRLFLTATPHNGYVESFSALLELLDNQRFARGMAPDPDRLAAVMVRRLKSDLPPEWDGTPRFQPREIAPLPVPYTDAERTVHGQLQAYSQLRRKHAVDPTERTASEFVLKLLKKRLFSSPAAFAHTLAQHKETIARGGQGQKAASQLDRPSPGMLRALLASTEQEYGDDAGYDEATESALTRSTQIFSALTPAEQTLLDAMLTWAEGASQRKDSKAEALFEWLHATLRPGGVWNDERVILFTEYRDTQKWLQTLLAAERLSEQGRLMVLYGGMDEEEREAIKAAFQADPQLSPVRILLATDAASEGIDLQRQCHRLVHYEIPWNPNRMEQRNGRIDRHGQQYAPLIYHFVPEGYAENPVDLDVAVGALEGDLEFLMRAVQKVEQIREDLGKVGPVIAEQVTAAMLGDRSRLQTGDAERQAEPVRKMLRFQQDVAERIERLKEQLQETVRTLDLTPQNVQAVVEIGLTIAGQPGLRPAPLPGIWPDSSGRWQTSPVFVMPPLSGAWAECSAGLAHPHTKALRPITFDHEVARGRDDVVLVHLNHRLVQMAMRLLRAEVWRRDPGAGLNRVTVRTVPSHVLESPAVIAHARLLMVGGDSHRLHEEIIETGGFLREGRFRRMAVGEVQDALAAATERMPGADAIQRLQAIWPTIADNLLLALDRRTEERAESLQRQLARQADKEAADITAILQELARQIETELDDPEMAQLPLFSDDERNQYSQNRSALRVRLQQIPGETELETAAIRRRYADPQARRFPVAVTFLVPERLA